jgi:hypothetical protein
VPCGYAEPPARWPGAVRWSRPESGTDAPARWPRARVPADVTVQTKAPMALALLDQAWQWGVPHRGGVPAAASGDPPHVWAGLAERHARAGVASRGDLQGRPPGRGAPPPHGPSRCWRRWPGASGAPAAGGTGPRAGGASSGGPSGPGASRRRARPPAAGGWGSGRRAGPRRSTNATGATYRPRRRGRHGSLRPLGGMPVSRAMRRPQRKGVGSSLKAGGGQAATGMR